MLSLQTKTLDTKVEVSMATREDNVYMAKLSEQAERYDEMVEAMKVGFHYHFFCSIIVSFFDINV